MPLLRYLENTLHGKVKPFITKCTLASILQTTDLHTSQRPDFLPPPTDLPLRHCAHAEIEGGEDEVLPEEECLLDLLSGGVTGNQQPKNKQHFVLATADPLSVKNKKDGQSGKARRPINSSLGLDLRARVREIPGVPIIYVKRSVMVLEELSGASFGVRRREEKDKFKEGLIGMESRKRKRDHDEVERDNDDKENGGEVDSAALKKKKSKKVRGPNPLSVMKKKPKLKVQHLQAAANVPAQASPSNVDGASTAETQPKAKRKRKHSKKGKSGGGGDGGHENIPMPIGGTINSDEG